MVHKVGNTCPSNSTTCEKQEAYRKDVKGAFGILQARWLIIRAPARGWSLEKLNFIVMSCIILDNMIVEDEWDDYTCGDSNDDEVDPNKSRRAIARIYDGSNLTRDPRIGRIPIEEYMCRHRSIRYRTVNNNLQKDLIAHLWAKQALE
ncbi:hypothetical protein L3X38_003734 [Prunus dulcis]|uniref:Uncharacterized protein n=1 Tax=Prunus dulcis TaxID=3755 RepID=A0AAD4ZML1_PRUDU|nr:hypothetical protein L3X38_003734 [Prunus dulcis]